MNRRDLIRALAALGAGSALPAFALDAAPAGSGAAAAAFDRAVAEMRWLGALKGVSAGTDTLRCDRLAVSGRWPAGLRGRFYRNGPALFERGGQRYRHWFDGDGMVQRFEFGPNGVSHLGRMVRTPKLANEREAGRFLVNALGTRIDDEAPVQGPDSFNTANTNAIEHAGRVLAMWEGGSAFALDPADLSTRGAVTWQPGLEQAPFSAHPKLDPQGNLWNIGTTQDKVVVWHVDPAGKLARVQIGESPYPGGMAHDVAITERYIVLPLPPVRLNFGRAGRGREPEQAMDFAPDQPLRILVMRKDDVAERRVFELPAQFVFHVGNAHERSDGTIVLSFVGAPDATFLTRDAIALMRGEGGMSTHTRTQVATLDMASGRARVDALAGAVEFPRIDPRRIGLPARHLVTAVNWKSFPGRGRTLFHGIQVQDLASGRVDRFDYGADAVVEEHIVVPKPGSTRELDAWLVGTTFDARRQATQVNVLDARRVADGPIAQATLPYALPLGFHGNFSAA
ncbi:carotenoid oxygenase family protein [Piscinibacter koreensis]|uniref:Carotenoid oxygenase family protein n=1 Tax=Piscinibacter koreensis TaxID=2742824 RepID=A0A7Y6TUQ3_9BURK|nr:carotenoid oxygenase family protein [Schlegelella koreensis]NUZ04294.1 carotenoid oxygenase family protein [Schlegelella koreensis]